MSQPQNSPRPFEILLVEDNEADVMLTQRALTKLGVQARLQVAGDGIEALHYLRHKPPYAETQLPDLILLDLNMPRMDGRQLLLELKRDENLKIIPVVILSTSASERDVHEVYRGYANSYLTKPLEFPEFVRRTQRFADFWLGQAAVLPSRI
jgi:CheY-like chemotaxis protein